MHVPEESRHLPENYGPQMRHLGIRLVVIGVTLVLRREQGQWPTATDVLVGLERAGLALDPPDDDIDATPEAVLWFNLAKKPDRNGEPSQWGIELWDPGAPGVVRVVVPAKVVSDLEIYTELQGYGAF